MRLESKSTPSATFPSVAHTLRVSGFGFQVSGLGFGVWGFRVRGFGLRVSGFRF